MSKTEYDLLTLEKLKILSKLRNLNINLNKEHIIESLKSNSITITKDERYHLFESYQEYLKIYNLESLKKLAKFKNIKNYSSKNKSELINLLMNNLTEQDIDLLLKYINNSETEKEDLINKAKSLNIESTGKNTSVLKKEINKQIIQNIELTNEQKNIINNFDKSKIINACAGSAKTSTIIFTVNEMIKNNIDPSSIFITSFTNSATKAIKEKLKTFGIKRCNVHTLDSVADSLCRRFYLDVDPLDFDGKIKKVLEIEKSINFKFPFKYIFIDEAQDISNLRWDFIKILIDTDSIVTIVGDTRQCLYIEDSYFDKLFINPVLKNLNLEVFFLSECFRNHQNIVNLSNDISKVNHKDIHRDITTKKNIKLDKIPIYAFSSEDEEYDYVCNKILELKEKYNLLFSDFCVMFPSSNTDKNGELPKIYLPMINKCIPFNNNYKDIDHTKNIVTVTTFHSCKGHEFKYVFILGIAKKVFPFDKVSNKIGLNTFYVALTRASEDVFLSFHSDRTVKKPCIYIEQFSNHFISGGNITFTGEYSRDIPKFDLKNEAISMIVKENVNKFYEKYEIRNLVNTIKSKSETINLYDTETKENIPSELKSLYGVYVDNIVKILICKKLKIEYVNKTVEDVINNNVVILTDEEISIIKKECTIDTVNSKIYMIENLKTKNRKLYKKLSKRVSDENILLSCVSFVNSKKYNKLDESEIAKIAEYYLRCKDFAQLDKNEKSILEISNDIFELSKCNEYTKEYGYIKLIKLNNFPLFYITEMIERLENNIENIINYCGIITKDDYFYDKLIVDSDYFLVGIYDCLFGDRILEIKSSSSDKSDEHFYQALLYSALVNKKNHKDEIIFYVFNHLYGSIIKYKITKNELLLLLETYRDFIFINNTEIYRMRLRELEQDRENFIENIDYKLKDINSGIFVLDFETDGINANSCNPVELTIMNYFNNFDYFSTLFYLDVHNFEFNGITNLRLKDAPNINEINLKIIDYISKHNYEKIYFIAHNGNTFDFKILERFLPKDFLDKIICLDSRNMITLSLQMRNQDINSVSLENLFNSITGTYIKGNHRATVDCSMLSCILDYYCKL